MSPRLPLAIITLLGCTVAAQAVPKTVGQAQALLTQMASAYQQTSAYTCTIVARQDGHEMTTVLRFMRPDMASLVTTNANGLMTEAVSDGTTVYQVGAGSKQYQADPVTSGQGAAAVLSTGADPLVQLLAHPQDILPELLPAASLGPPRPVAGTPTDTVIVTLPSERITLSLSQDDHRIRQLTFATAAKAGAGVVYKTQLTETVTASSAAPSLVASDFTFTPPAGAQKVASLVPPNYDARLKVGADPLPFTASDLSGRPVTLDAYKGKVVMLDFWATWCPPCRGEIPNVVATYAKYHPQGFDVVGVSLDQPNDRAALETFLTQNHMAWRQIYDGGGWQSALAKQYGVQAIPFSLLIGKDGKIAAVGDALRGPGLDPAVQAALAH